MGWRGTACAGAVALVASVVPAAGASGAERAVCGPAGAKTLKQAGSVRVYRLRSGDGATFGCMRGVGRSFRLDDPHGVAEDRTVRARGPIAVAGRFVVVVTDGDGSDGADDYFFTSVDRHDLRTGKRRFSGCTDVGEDDEDDTCEDGLAVPGLVLRRTGGYAYLQRLEDGERRVVRFDRREHSVLDRGRDIERRSLRLDGATLSWRRGGASKTASLF